MFLRSGAEFFRMMNTVSSKIILLLLLFLFVSGTGCSLLQFREERSLAVLQSAVRQRMLKLQSSELLVSAAQERYKPGKAAEVFALGAGYQEQHSNVEKDLALQVLEQSITYALMVLSRNPEETAEKLTAASLDYGTALRLLKLQSRDRALQLSDAAAELAMMTGWSMEKVNSYASALLPEIRTGLFPVYPEAERLLNEKGNAAAFEAASELYRTPGEAELFKCERLRRAILNRYLMQTKSPGGETTPELRIAVWRSRLFLSLLPPL